MSSTWATIRCASTGITEEEIIDEAEAKSKVKFGTKMSSMTSKCRRSETFAIRSISLFN
jgi:hypothetical protein